MQGDATKAARALVGRVVRAVEASSGPPEALEGVRKSARRKRRTSPATLWDNVRRSRGCWPWTGPVDYEGTPYLRVDGRRVPVHRYVWRHLMRRELAPGERLKRTCANRLCVRPEHLERRGCR